MYFGKVKTFNLERENIPSRTYSALVSSIKYNIPGTLQISLNEEEKATDCNAVCWAAPCSPPSPGLIQLQTTEKEPGVRDRDVNGLTEGGAYLSDVKSWSNTPPCVVHGRQDMVAVFAGVRGALPVTGEIDVRLTHWLPGKPAEGHTRHHPYDKLL